MVDLVGHTRTAAGLRVKAKLDKRRYPTGRIVTRAEMQDLALHSHAFHGDWNYELRSRSGDRTKSRIQVQEISQLILQRALKR